MHQYILEHYNNKLSINNREVLIILQFDDVKMADRIIENLTNNLYFRESFLDKSFIEIYSRIVDYGENYDIKTMDMIDIGHLEEGSNMQINISLSLEDYKQEIIDILKKISQYLQEQESNDNTNEN